MNSFRVSKPLSNIDKKNDKEIKRFGDDAERHEVKKSSEYLMDEKPQKSFTIPLNDYELDLLRRASQKDDRSQRYMSRTLLVKALKDYLGE
jgi:hypothetical protein